MYLFIYDVYFICDSYLTVSKNEHYFIHNPEERIYLTNLCWDRTLYRTATQGLGLGHHQS